LAGELVALFKDRFFDRGAGVLTEYFSDTLEPAAGSAGQVVAPGHHFEWAWLLQWAQRLGVGGAPVEARALYDFAIGHGLDGRGMVIDECDRQGRQVRLSRRAWPQTELIKARLTAAGLGVAGAEDAAAEAALAFMDTHLATQTRGLWMDQFDAQGRGMTEMVPASTLYHVVVAFRELALFAAV
jgi:mannose/cellobiose epimerase-like protein (N-acyl-D-glucosamine 2-epimerase family)